MSENEFIARMDKDPFDHGLRMAYAYYLGEYSSPRAAGYRALASLRRVPCHGSSHIANNEGANRYFIKVSQVLDADLRGLKADGLADKGHLDMMGRVIQAVLPDDWWDAMRGTAERDGVDVGRNWNTAYGWGGYDKRRKVEDMAASAFATLPTDRRNYLLTVATHVPATWKMPEPPKLPAPNALKYAVSAWQTT